MPINPYTSQSISGYNSSPPPDDGSQTAANKVEWAKHKEKIGDPLKTLVEAVNSQCSSAFNTVALEDWSVHTTTATIAESDWHNGILMTASGRVNYPDPATLENGWHNYVFNGATTSIVLEATATSYFRRRDGRTASGMSMLPGELVKVFNTATQYLVQGNRQSVYLANAYTFDTSYVTATVNIPFDNSIPQATEGAEALVLNYQPQETGNLLEIEGSLWVCTLSNTSAIVALFQGATGTGGTATTPATGINALWAGGRSFVATDHLSELMVHYWSTTTATNTHTFTLRYGANTGNSFLNGISSGRILGGIHFGWLKITEYEV